MSAYAAIPWVYACVSAIGDDASRLPVRIVDLGTGRLAPENDDVGLRYFLEHPSPRVGARLFAAQAIVDRVLTGGAFARLVGTGRRATGRLRLHPEHVEVLPASNGEPGGYLWDGTTRLPWEEVLALRSPSWSSSPSGLFGTGAIESLNSYLSTDVAGWRRRAEMMRRGRPDAIVSPADGDLGVWSPTQVVEIKGAVQAMFDASHGGVGVLGHKLDLAPLSWSPKDLGDEEVHVAVRVATLAVLGVPPARLGLETANYATAREQLASYWESRILPLAGELDEWDTAYLLALTGNRRLAVRRDLSRVRALQYDRSERLFRVASWVALGWSAETAAQIEGFDDLPKPDGDVEVPETDAPTDGANDAPEDAPNDAPEDAPAQQAAGLAAAAMFLSLPPVPSAERSAGTRERAWRAYIARVQGPAERRLRAAVAGYLRGAGARYSERLQAALEPEQRGGVATTTRTLTDAVLDAIAADLVEQGILRGVVEPELRTLLRSAFASTLAELDLDLDWTPDRTVDPAALAQRIAQDVVATTREAVRRIVSTGLTDGATITEMQAAIKAAGAFSPMRARRIARTEANLGAQLGANGAYDAAAAEGVEFELEWSSSRDSEVRDTHRAMDGQRRRPGERFQSPSGDSALHPCGFSRASENVNCRCTRLPVLVEAP
jgi:phage portal protein BeeE